MAQIWLSTTGTLSPVVINDMGQATFTHSTTNLPLIRPDGQFTDEDVRISNNLIDAVTAGYITLINTLGDPVTNLAELQDSVGEGDNLGNHILTENLDLNGNDIIGLSIDNADFADMPANTIKARAAGTAGAPADLAIADGQMLIRPVGQNLQSGSPFTVRTLLNVEDGATADVKASGAEVNAGIDNEKFVTPATLASASGVVHTTGVESIGGQKTFTEDQIVIDAPSGSDNLLIGYFLKTIGSGYGIGPSTGGLINISPNSINPQIIMGAETNASGEGFIDVDDNRTLNLNTLDTGTGSPGAVVIGTGGLSALGPSTISTGGIVRFQVETDGTLNVGNTVDYETQVTADDDIPNKKYVDDEISASVAASVQIEWKFSTSTTVANPGSKQFRLNNSNPALATKLAINDIAESNLDASSLLSALSAGDKIYIQEIQNGIAYVLATVVSVTDQTGWFEIDITVDDAGVLFGSGKRCLFVLVYSGLDYNTTDDLPEGTTNKYYSDALVAASPAVTANTAKVSADGSVDAHSDVDISTVVPSVGSLWYFDGSNYVPYNALLRGANDFLTFTVSAAGHPLTIRNNTASGEFIQGLNQNGNQTFELNSNGTDGIVRVFKDDGTIQFEVANDRIRTYLPNYETLVTDPNHIPNKKYVDDNAGGLVATYFNRLTTDVTTTSVPPVWSTLLTQNVTPNSASNSFLINFTAVGDNTNDSRAMYFRIRFGLTGGETTVGGTQLHVIKKDNQEINSAAFVSKESALSTAQHTIIVEWAVENDTGRIRPASFPEMNHANLLIQEVSV